MTLSIVLIAWLLMVVTEIIIYFRKQKSPDSSGKGWRIIAFIIIGLVFIGLYKETTDLISQLEFLGASFLFIFLYISTERARNFLEKKDEE